MPWRWFALLVALVLSACTVPAVTPTATPPPSPSASIVASPTVQPPTPTPAATASVVASPVRAQPTPRPSATVAAVATATPVVATPTTVSAAQGWPVFDFDPARSGVNPNERVIGPDNVAMLRVLWSRRLPDVADSTPVYRAGRLYLTLRNGSTVALDASTGEQIWLARTTGPKITNSSPAIDPSGKWVYAYGLDGSVHKYDAETGQEAVGGGWPARVTTLTDVEKESSSLNLANGKLYVTTSGYLGDYGHYAGHLVVVDLASGATTVFNSLCSNIRTLLTDQQGQQNYCPSVQSGVWARAGAVVDPTSGNVFIATGNGPWNGSTNWGDSVLEISGDGQKLLDSYTPTNQQQLNDGDVDLGSTAPALLPEQPTSRTPYLAVQGGKDGELKLLNRRDLSGKSRPGQLGGELQIVDAPGRCSVLTAPAVWTAPNRSTWLFVADSCGLTGFTLGTDASGQSKLAPRWQERTGGTSPVLANGVLYVAHSGAVEARDPTTGHLLWTSPNGTVGSIHWESPIVVDGKLIISDESRNVTAFGVGNG